MAAEKIDYAALAERMPRLKNRLKRALARSPLSAQEQAKILDPIEEIETVAYLKCASALTRRKQLRTLRNFLPPFIQLMEDTLARVKAAATLQETP